jgi:hypothetical protein
MRRLTVIFTLALALVAGLTVPTGAASTCASDTYSRADFHRVAKKAFRSKPYTTKERREVECAIRRQKTKKSRRIVHMHYTRYYASYKRRNAPGPTIRGRVSWFTDHVTASGISGSTPGVAIRPGATYHSGRPYLRGYWRVRIGEHSAVLRQIDIGPHQWTNRRIDVTRAALKYFPGFRTDAIGTATYLGKRR